MRRWFLALAVVIAWGSASADPPQVTIRARTMIHFEGIRRGYDGVYVASGQLRDKMTGVGLSGQRVQVEVAGQTLEALTTQDGDFAIALPTTADGKHDLELSFDGSSLLDASALSLDDIEVDKQHVTIKLTANPISNGVSIAVETSAGDTQLPLRVAIHAGPAEADPVRLPKIAEVSGGNSVVVTRAMSGGAGRRRARAVFAGDQVNAAATADITFELSTATSTRFELDDRDVAFESRVAGGGSVLDEDGKGVGRAPVTLLAGDRRLAETTTKADGSFRVGIEAKILGEGSHGLQAVVERSSAFLRASRSDIIVVKIAAPQPVPVAFTAAAFVLTGLVAGGFFLLRARPWDRRRKMPPPADRAATVDETGDVKGGLVQARPSLVSTLRRASDFGLAGTIRDAVRGRAIAGATVRLRLSDGKGGVAHEQTVVAGDDGAFAAEGLAAGEWKAKVIATGHVSERFGVSIPHRGELRGVRVDMVPVREQIFSMYKVAAQPILPEARLWGVWSPRQIVNHVRRHRPTPALAELTDFVEEAYFSARMPDEEILPTAQARVEAAVVERARVV